MIKQLHKESTLVSDTGAKDDALPEQPIIVEDYAAGEGISVVGWDGKEVYIPYRMVKDLCKVMTSYANKPKKGK